MQKTICEKWEEEGCTNLPANSILKLVYKREYFDIEEMRVCFREVITITDDGSIERKEYKRGSRKACSAKSFKCSTEDYDALCEEIERCIQYADRRSFYVDDTSVELKLYHRFGRVQTVDRGMGNGECDIGGILCNFFGQHGLFT